MISIILNTGDFRGDHAADVRVAYELIESETVVELVARLIGRDRSGVSAETESIELRLVKKAGKK